MLLPLPLTALANELVVHWREALLVLMPAIPALPDGKHRGEERRGEKGAAALLPHRKKSLVGACLPRLCCCLAVELGRARRSRVKD